MKKYLDPDQHRLYELIWKRAIASQMEAARFDRVGVDIESDQKHYLFRATGQQLKFPGFIALYVEGKDDPEEEKENDEKLLPFLTQGSAAKARNFQPNQHFTQPPPRYTEAGRPSTYAPTISTIMTRGYVNKIENYLAPTDTGEVVTDFLVQHFPKIVDVGFTAKMEEDLDHIAEGKEDWLKFLKLFYQPFHENVEEKNETLKKKDVITEKTDEKCEQCGKPMVVKLGRFGKFLSCSDYPHCKNAKPLVEKEVDKAAAEEFAKLQKKLSGKICSKCGQPMELKKGRYGEFLGCSGYPKCHNMQPIVKFAEVKCPDCKDGQLVERRTKKGARVFYGCNKFPKCKFALWDKPVNKKCKDCKGLMVEKGDKIICSLCKKGE
ncbi:MAG: topoisomerase I, DNA topoisomerase I protein [Candidatus Peregrinibacteria bacterium GW2011_GWE2_39_6]|nr:MAG: topoisomerase I, DNA topoisomerase I protein [Candidatus Peregrinibacteria bacterium GW2011_GWE2_39_6]